MKKKFLIVAGSVCLLFLIAACCLLVPIKTSDSITVPAMILCNGKLESTNLSIVGTWTHSIAIPSRQSFAGTIQIDRLDYTHEENSWDLRFQIADDISSNYLTGGFFYNSTGSFTGYGWLYTDKNHNSYVLVTNQFDSQNEDYIVIAPAETMEEAQSICDIMGLSYLQDAELQNDISCYSRNGTQTYDLSADNRTYITDLLNNALWINDLGNCASDFLFRIQEREIWYHSECGTFNDYTNNKCVTVSEEQRTTINAMLGIN